MNDFDANLDVRLQCGNCGRALDDAPTLSSHRTSQGPIWYRRCVCGRISVEWRGSVLSGAGPTPCGLWSGWPGMGAHGAGGHGDWMSRSAVTFGTRLASSVATRWGWVRNGE